MKELPWPNPEFRGFVLEDGAPEGIAPISENFGTLADAVAYGEQLLPSLTWTTPPTSDLAAGVLLRRGDYHIARN